MSSLRTARLVFAALSLGACAPRAALVSSDGWAAEDPARPGEASRRAIADALRRAVERAAGVSLTARTRVSRGVAVSENVVADTVGCVLDYKVVSEGSINGGRAARVRARIATGTGPCAGKPPLPPAALEGAKVSVSISGSGEQAQAAAAAAQSALRSELSRRGWTVVDGPTPLRLSGTASVYGIRDPRLSPLSSFRAELSLRVEVDGHGVLRESWARGTAVDADPDDAVRRAARAAATRAAAEMSETLEAQLWALSD